MLGRKDVGYDAHYYGPYSPLVASVNHELKSLGFVRESVASAETYDQRGFEVARHDFSLTDDGRAVAESKKNKLAAEWTDLKVAAHKLQSLGDIDYVQLSIAAKAYFLLSQAGKPATNRDVAEMAKTFNWSVTEADVQGAVNSLRKLDLVVRSETAETSGRG